MKPSETTSPAASTDSARRKLLTGVAAASGAAVVLPTQWSKPVVNAITLPAHAETTSATAAPMTIADTAVASAPEFTTLVGALSAAGLVETLQNEGPFTVFAPTNAAFAAIEETVAGLTTEQLEAVLLYHVLPGIQPASAIPPTSGAPASVLATVEASNGIIYVIDQVLLP